VGGDASITLNSELQYDLTESTVGVLFIDVGQAFLHSKGSFQGDDPDLKDFRYSPGVGLRYRTPIGPITSDLGLNPDREHGERWGRLFVSIGGAF
jgi:outer membrane protein assembly factor BamA